MKNEKNWSLRTIITLFIVITPFLFIAFGNFLIDPLWLFSHKNSYNDVQNPFDERLLKTNEITYSNHVYDGILIGTSRVTYMNQHHFPEPVFNMAVSSMLLEEYDPYLTYAEQQNGKIFQTIYLGLDFWQTNRIKPALMGNPIDAYTKPKEEPFYRLKQLFSYDTWTYTKQNVESSKANQIMFNGFRSYDRNNVATAKEVSLNEKKKYLKDYMETEANSSYAYDVTYRDRLIKLKEHHPKSHFVVFLTPVYVERFKMEVNTPEKQEAYKRWVKESVSVFGSVYDFMVDHPVTRTWDHFYDTQHSYPEVSDLMIQRMLGEKKDFGILLTNENVEGGLTEILPKIETGSAH